MSNFQSQSFPNYNLLAEVLVQAGSFPVHVSTLNPVALTLGSACKQGLVGFESIGQFQHFKAKPRKKLKYIIILSHNILEKKEIGLSFD